MKKLNNITVALTTNFDQTKNIVKAKDTLMTFIENPRESESVWTLPESDKNRNNFLNCVVSGETHYGMPQLEKAFKYIEMKCGRTRSDDSRGIAKMNIKLLQYGEESFNTEYRNKEYVQKLLQESVPATTED